MSWAGLASNQTISFNNLQNGVDTGQFTAKTTIPVSNEQITKADANTYVNIDTSYESYAAKASNQLVVKSDLVTTTSTTTTTTAATTTTTTTTTVASTGYYFDSTSNVSGTVACGNYLSNTTMYAAESNPANVSRFFTDAGLTTPYGGNGNFYVWSFDNVNTYVGTIDNNGYTNSVSVCP